MLQTRACALLFLAVVAGCGKRTPLLSNASLSVVDASQLPPPSAGDLIGPERASLLGAGDQISVEIFGVPELSRQVKIAANGTVALPLIGSIAASGKSPSELGTEIAGLLRGRYVRNPQVNVNVVEAVSQVVTVDGEVREPGLYPVSGRMTLLRAVATAKGPSEYAKLDDIVVFRTVGGRRLAALYNLGAIRRGIYADPDIFPNDVVVVGDSPARRLFKDIAAVSPLLAGPVIALIQNSNQN